jgi:DNA polymerase I
MKNLYKKILDEVNQEHKITELRERNSRVLIIDGLNTFIRAWTTNPSMNEDGDHIGGVVGFLNSVAFQIREFNPTRVIITFDGKGGSDSRKKLYEGYKSDRGKNRFRVNRQYVDMMDEEEERLSMKQQFVWLNDILNHLPLKVMMYDGIEADDVISYLTMEVVKGEVIIVSTDKDFLQLVDDRITVYSPTKKRLYNRDLVFEEFGIWPQNILIYRVLDGDTSDGIKGVQGCALKTILKRFPEFSEDRLITYDEIFSLAENRRGTLKIYDTVLANKEQILLNKRLMELDISHIPKLQRLQILDRFAENDPSLNKKNFLAIGMKYKLLSSWKDLMGWLNSSFGSLVVE